MSDFRLNRLLELTFCQQSDEHLHPYFRLSIPPTCQPSTRMHHLRINSRQHWWTRRNYLRPPSHPRNKRSSSLPNRSRSKNHPCRPVRGQTTRQPLIRANRRHRLWRVGRGPDLRECKLFQRSLVSPHPSTIVPRDQLIFSARRRRAFRGMGNGGGFRRP